MAEYVFGGKDIGSGDGVVGKKATINDMQVVAESEKAYDFL